MSSRMILLLFGYFFILFDLNYLIKNCMIQYWICGMFCFVIVVHIYFNNNYVRNICPFLGLLVFGNIENLILASQGAIV